MQQLPWKPAVQCGWPADQVEVVGFVDSQRFMDVAVRIDICSHGAVQGQAARREEAPAVIRTSKTEHQNGPLKAGVKHTYWTQSKHCKVHMEIQRKNYNAMTLGWKVSRSLQAIQTQKTQH